MSFLGGALGAGPSNNQKQANNLLNSNAQAGAASSQTAQNTGMGFLKQFSDTLAAPTNYFQQILSGNKQAMTQAVAPTAQAISSQYDTAAQGVARNSPRGGYSAAAQANLPFTKAQQIGNLFSTLQPMAAQGLMGIAGQQGQVGSTLFGQGANYLNAGTNAAGTFGQQSQNQQQFQYNQGIGFGMGLGGLLAGPLSGGLSSLLGGGTAGNPGNSASNLAQSNIFKSSPGDLSSILS